MTPPAWDPSMPLRWNASDEEIAQRYQQLKVVRVTTASSDHVLSWKLKQNDGQPELWVRLVAMAREFATASVAHALHERDGAQDREEKLDLGTIIMNHLEQHGATLMWDLADTILAAGFRRSPVQERGADTKDVQPRDIECEECSGRGYRAGPVCCGNTLNGECRGDCAIEEQTPCPHCRTTGKRSESLYEYVDRLKATRSASPPAPPESR